VQVPTINPDTARSDGDEPLSTLGIFRLVLLLIYVIKGAVRCSLLFGEQGGQPPATARAALSLAGSPWQGLLAELSHWWHGAWAPVVLMLCCALGPTAAPPSGRWDQLSGL